MSEEILIDLGPAETRVALIEGGRLAEVRIERPDRHSSVGNIWRGRVSRVVPGMQAAFVEIGLAKAGFLAARDARASAPPEPSPETVGGDEPAPPTISRLVHEGEAILVQAIKDPLGDKGVKLTTDISLPGRLLVLTPFRPGIHLSRRLEAPEERERLASLLEGALQGAGDAGAAGGLILRTAAAGAAAADLLAEARYLAAEWRRLEKQAAVTAVPGLLWRDLDPVARALRDHVTPATGGVWINSAAGFAAARAYAAERLPGLAERIRRHEGDEPLFARFGAEADLARALEKRVALPSGGAITIETTQALAAIDVDSGSFVGRDLDETSRRTNLEAAAEIARQLRLRGLGGIIVIDFIHLARTEDRAELIAQFQAALAADRAPTHVLGLSEFGLVEMTRKRTGEPLAQALSEPCDLCGGSGRRPSPATVAAEALRRAEREAKASPGRGLTLLASPEIVSCIDGLNGALAALEKSLGVSVTVRPDPALRREEYDVAAG